MKRRFAFFAALCMLLSIAAYNSLAYFTAEETVRNVITSGAVHIQVVERQRTDEGLKPCPPAAIPVMPGSEVSRIVSVQNLDEPVWVRMTYTVTVLDADGAELNLTPAELDQLLTIDTDTVSWSCQDGWWYYAHALAAGEEAGPLFTEVAFSGSGMGNAYQNCTVIIDVVAQAVQKIHNGDTVMDAAGWPAA